MDPLSIIKEELKAVRKEDLKAAAEYLGFVATENIIQDGVQVIIKDENKSRKCNVNFYNTGKRLPQGNKELLQELVDTMHFLKEQSRIEVNLLEYGVVPNGDYMGAIRDSFGRLESLAREKVGTEKPGKQGAQLLEYVASPDYIRVQHVHPDVIKGFRNNFGKLLASFYSCFRNPLQHAGQSDISKWLTNEDLKLLLATGLLLESLFKRYVLGRDESSSTS